VLNTHLGYQNNKMNTMTTNTENSQLVKQPAQRTSALTLMASRLSVDPTKLLDTLKATCFKGASNEELLALVAVSNRYGLDPLTKQIYAFPSKGGITPVVSVDGWLHILNSQPQFDGVEFVYTDDSEGNPYSVTAVIHRKDRQHPTKVTEYFSECARNTEPWKQFPRRMLRHKVVKEAVRVAFGISGVTDEDEARDIARNAALVAEPVVAAKPVFSRKKKDESVSAPEVLVTEANAPVVELELEEVSK
jgi:phage recombination protein Bet